MSSFKAVAMTAVLAVCLSGCGLRKRTVKAAPAPPPPPPAAAEPKEPLSIPQTSVELPPAQPLDPRALETAEAPAPQPQEPAPALPKAPRRAAQPPTATTGPQPPQPPAEAVQGPPAPEERPRLQEIVPPEEKRRLAEAIAARKREIEGVLQQAAGRRLSHQDRTMVERIRSFLLLSDQAAARDDMRQAEALSERALVLARELRGAR